MSNKKLNYNTFYNAANKENVRIEKTSKVTDPTEIFAKVLDYILGRIPNRFNNLEECETKFNDLFKEAVTVVQDNYNRFFKTELRGNLKNYNIEIMGGEPTIEKPIEEGGNGDGNNNGNNNNGNSDNNEGGKPSPGEATVDKMKEKGLTVDQKQSMYIDKIYPNDMWEKD